MSEKKRKRHEDGAERPKKKVVIAQEGAVKVEMLQNKEVLGPLLAATPGLIFPPSIFFSPYKRTKILPEGATHTLLLQSSEHPRLDYTAEEERDGSSESQLKDYIGVFDPATKKLQLVPVKRVTVRSTLRSETEEMREEQEKLEARQATMMAKRHALAAEFGSKKSRKAIEDMTLNAIRSGNPTDPASTRNEGVAENILNNMTTATGTMPTKEDLAAAVDKSKPRPTPNMAAEYPTDVYPIETVVGSELMTMIEIKYWVDASEAGQGVSVTSKYVAKRITRLSRNKQIQKLKVLQFIYLCINFAAALSGPTGRPKKIPPKGKLEDMMGDDAPAGCVMAIRRKFAAEGSFEMPRWNIDNLMTHIAAASLIVDDFEVDVNDLRDDLKLENKEIKAYFQELGCRVNNPTATEQAKWKLTKAEAVNHNIAKLKLPLQFPKVGGPRKGRR
ncbi:DNA-directed RNA polymeras-like protein I 49 kDa polypeptide [Setomelanomma holmii]|uniref:DNA-directed RNA polymeras-like protein I 49 kDa polypeptide n=1 Tax=Setomelanomma holmii TaxID=210430 RepID=A0A9P4LLV9_9PLEO|nr:DNA-directed RNA polymeras-like protein I 49 kDa polypeptide [Setomelanomma holmii]